MTISENNHEETIDTIVVFLINWVVVFIGTILSIVGTYIIWRDLSNDETGNMFNFVLVALGIMLIARHAPKTK